MAIIDMKKLVLIGLNTDRKRILKSLHKLGCVELSSVNEIENTQVNSDIITKDKLSTKLSKITFAFTFMKEMRLQALKLSEKYKKLYAEAPPTISEPDNRANAVIEYTPPKKPFLLGLPGVVYDKFDSIISREEDLLEIINKVESINSSLVDIKSEMIRINSLKDQLQPYIDVDTKFSKFSDTKTVSIMLGQVPNNRIAVVDEIGQAFKDIVVESFAGKKTTAIVIIAPISYKEEILAKLIEADYIQNNFIYDLTAKEKIVELDSKYIELDNIREKLVTDAIGLEKFIPDLELLYDYYLLELKKAEADDRFRFTGSTFVLEGWMPKEAEQKLTDKLNKEFTLHIETRDAEENEVVPTLTRNNSFVAPYEEITNMYSVPNNKEIDPNPFVALFYFIFFGIMVSDAGYGIILSIIAYVLYKWAKPRKGEGKLVLVIGMGGISTFLWGVMFGGWFGITWRPLLFNPLDQPLAMLGMCLGLGIFQILFGMGIKAVSLIREKKILDAVFNIFGWYVVFLGLGMFAISMVPGLEIMKGVGGYTALGGVVGVFIGGGLGKKNVFSAIAGGLGNLYSSTGFLSDILSYSRLFGLGLATGVVGMVINQLATVVVNLIPFGIGYVFAVPILIGGHIFNIAINTLGAYVHNSRLQYIEFFSRFYTGSGHQFVPFGSNTKYIFIDN